MFAAAERQRQAVTEHFTACATIIRSVCAKYQIDPRTVDGLQWIADPSRIRIIDGRAHHDGVKIDPGLHLGSDRDIAKCARRLLREHIAGQARDRDDKQERDRIEQEIARLHRKVEAIDERRAQWRRRRNNVTRTRKARAAHRDNQTHGKEASA